MALIVTSANRVVSGYHWKGMPAALKKLGRYQLLDRIAAGGSAEIYRGIYDHDGMQRLVAVKCVASARANDPSFLKFFRDEIRLSLGFDHAGIVRTLDFGEDEGRPFIVFEFVHGRSLRQILDRMAKLGRPFPISLAAFIAEQALVALQYAHAFQEPLTGRTVTIVHRDISPQNIMVSYDGIPRLIDFGIAKVLQDGDRTASGYIKGKPAYLSPEQAAGSALDPRSDIFSLGTVLWECLAGRRLFGGQAERGTIMQSILDPSFVISPPSAIDARVPPELDEIVLRALERDREKRFHSALEMQSALHRLLKQSTRDAYWRKLSAIMNDLFAEQIAEDEQGLKRLTAIAEELTHSTMTDASWLIPMRSKNTAVHEDPDPLDRTATHSTNLIRLKQKEKASGVRDLELDTGDLAGAELEGETKKPAPQPIARAKPAPAPRPQSVGIRAKVTPSERKPEPWPRSTAASAQAQAQLALSRLRAGFSAARAKLQEQAALRSGQRPENSPSPVRYTLMAAVMAGSLAAAFLVATTPMFNRSPPPAPIPTVVAVPLAPARAAASVAQKRPQKARKPARQSRKSKKHSRR